MDPFIGGALIGGAANVIGGLFGQSSARAAYQSRYQDTVADMKKAGLNPALAYGQNPGGGAQTRDFGQVGSQAMSAMQAAAQADKTKAETDLLKAQTQDLILRPRLENAYLNAGIENRKAGTDVNTARAGLYQYDIAGRKRTFESDVTAQLAANEQQRLATPEARARAKYYTQVGPGAYYFNNATEAAKAAAQVYGSRGLNKPRINNYYPRNR